MLMGLNSLRILEELLAKHPLALSFDSEVLDFGCGKGLTSICDVWGWEYDDEFGNPDNGI